MNFTVSDSIQIMKALADSSRLLILNSLFEKPQYVEELSKRFDLAASTVSFHLKKLEEAHLVVKDKKQYYSEFRINDVLFDKTLFELTSFENVEKFVQDERMEKYKTKVINTFIVNGQLAKLPAQLKKRLIILDWFAARFDKDREYTEAEVSEVISQTFEDYCLIRREMIDLGLMSRQKNLYKRR